MANPYFQFKQFTVYHDRCALKVSTDSCIFGAWVASFLNKQSIKSNHVLDIGAGSGLLMLMLAQQHIGLISGIEIDVSSFQQATENLQNSSWKDQLHLHLGDAALFQYPHQYDFIISNPPFFEGDLKSEKHALNVAKHDAGLTLDGLLKVADCNATQNAQMALLLPYHRMVQAEKMAGNHHFYVHKRLLVKQNTTHNYFRSLLLFGRTTQPMVTEELVIQQGSETYSDAFIDLLKDYYLYL